MSTRSTNKANAASSNTQTKVDIKKEIPDNFEVKVEPVVCSFL